MANKWEFWIDCGGTFTDIVAVAPNDNKITHKLLTKSPHYRSSVVEGIKQIMADEYAPEKIKRVRLGTTVATNAFLERKGVSCALVTTMGLRDVLHIRRQNRPDLFELDIKKAAPLCEGFAHIKERLDAKGEVVTPLDEEVARFELGRLKEQGHNSLAICLMHATINSAHEVRLGEIAKEVGFQYVALSHQVSPVSKFIYRAETTAADAYLTPLLSIYTQELAKEMEGVEFVYMQSDGGLCKAELLKGQNSLLSGPAGGLVGAVKSAAKRGINKIITFDMGGTSTDVAIYDNKLNLDTEPNFHGLTLLAPMLDIHTVAAGGGSILKFDGERFMVGPESAGAYPGPACYRNGGPLTVTDANLFLGRLEADKFPKIFGPNRDEALDEEAARKKFEELAKETGMDAKDVAQGFLDVAANTMARAIKKVSVERGQDPKEFVLASFGGAAGQMACKVAEAVGMREIFVHPYSSVLSAYGIGHADEKFQAKKRVEAPLKNWPHLASFREELEKECLKALPKAQEFQTVFYLKARGSDYELAVHAQDLEKASELFEKEYHSLFGLHFEGDIEIASLGLEALLRSGFEGEVREGEEAQSLRGPKVLSSNKTCIVLEPGWKGEKNEHGEWRLRLAETKQGQFAKNEKIQLEIFYQRFQSIAEQMGHTLQSLAHSITIKERNDFSCAIFTAKGELLSNAPHIPVHLGSMGDAVVAVKNKFKSDIRPGDGFVCNDPNQGGTHLPDLTVITPVFLEGELSLFVASRGHHGDIGGITPGSMPGNSKKLIEEGVIISPIKAFSDGKIQEKKLIEILQNAKWPARNPSQNIHDIKAQHAANLRGVSELVQLSEISGKEHIIKMAEEVLSYSHRKIKSTLKSFEAGAAEIQIADDRFLKLKAGLSNDKLVLDFAGTSPCSDSNFNAPLPVVKASVLFALRCVIKENIPLNDGIARFLDIKIPEGSLLNPRPDSAIVAGNVETSQLICDLVFEALGAKANSQGTMNNLTFGNDNFQYYETLGGGSGATITGDGASAVQVNMTNSLLTDPEVFELRLPVRLELMAVRRGSGGKGARRGGDGLYRRILFLEDCEASMLSQRRKTAPKGILGGERAKRGANLLENAAGAQELDECFQIKVKKGEILNIQTPGGGGHGEDSSKKKNYVFSYGSNMDLAQIKKRCPSSKLEYKAKLRDFELRYSIYSDMRKGGVADTYHAPGKIMYGLIFSMNDEDLAVLDDIECGKGHYSRVERVVEDDNGERFQVYCYDVNDKDPDVPPTAIYRWLVYSGALMLGAPEKYLADLNNR